MDRVDKARVAPGDRRDEAVDRRGPPALVEVAGLVKRYGKTVAVDGATFEVREGEIFGLLGPNGAGKTTTISIIATLLRASAGVVRVSGLDVAERGPEVRRLLGLVPQEIGIYPSLSAWENLEYFSGLYGLWGRARRARIQEVLDIVGLSRFARKPVTGKFSGGMRRRLSLAAGLIHKPRLLLLDEPTVGVDPQSRNAIFEDIRRLQREEGVSVLYTTHYMEEAESLCDRVAIMDYGRIVACDTVPALVRSIEGTVFRLSLPEASPAFDASVSEQPGILSVSRVSDTEYQLVAADQASGLEALLGLVARHGLKLRSLDVSAPNLEQVFLKLTGKELRDE